MVGDYMPYINFKINTFEKGINQERDKQLVPLSYSIDGDTITTSYAWNIENCDISKGVLKRSRGASLYDEYLTLPYDIKTLMRYYAGGTGHIIAACNGRLYKVLNGTYTLIGSGYSSDDWDYINYQSGMEEIIIMTNGIDTPKVYDGFNIRDLKYEGSDSDESSTNKAPSGKYIELYKERVWMAGVDIAPNRLYFSKDFDADDWTAPVTEGEANQHGGAIDIPTWDGGSIIALKSLFRGLLVFKDKHVFNVYGTYPGNFTVDEIFNSVTGKIYNKTIQAIENTAFWLATDGIYIYNGSSIVRISTRIRDFWDSINTDSLENAFGIIYNRKYICFVPTENSTIPNKAIEYDIENDSIVIRDGINASSCVEFDNKLVYSIGKKLYVYDSGDSYNGDNINSVWESGDLVFTLRGKKSLDRGYMVASGNGTIRITSITEIRTVTYDVELSEEEKEYILRFKNKGRRWNIKIENLNGCDFTIKQPEFVFDVDYD